MRPLIVGLVATLGAFAADIQPAESISVWLYNYAGLDEGLITLARAEAFRILGDSGIGIQWVDCPRSRGEEYLYPECRAALHPRAFVVRLHSGSPRPELALEPKSFGTAYLPGDGEMGSYASVWAEGAEIFSKSNAAQKGAMLGHLIAHELSHLLLGQPEHSVSGLMRSPWHDREIGLAAQGALRFNSAHTERMLANLRTHSPAFQVVTVPAVRGRR